MRLAQERERAKKEKKKSCRSKNNYQSQQKKLDFVWKRRLLLRPGQKQFPNLNQKRGRKPNLRLTREMGKQDRQLEDGKDKLKKASA